MRGWSSRSPTPALYTSEYADFQGGAGSVAPGQEAIKPGSDCNDAPAAALQGGSTRVCLFTRSCVLHRWRMEAETKLRARSKGGMTDEEVVDFVDRYMPAYKVLHF